MSDSNVFNWFFVILYWCFSEKGETIGLLSWFYTDVSQKKREKIGLLICSGGCLAPLPPPPYEAQGAAVAYPHPPVSAPDC